MRLRNLRLSPSKPRNGTGVRIWSMAWDTAAHATHLAMHWVPSATQMPICKARWSMAGKRLRSINSIPRLWHGARMNFFAT